MPAQPMEKKWKKIEKKQLTVLKLAPSPPFLPSSLSRQNGSVSPVLFSPAARERTRMLSFLHQITFSSLSSVSIKKLGSLQVEIGGDVVGGWMVQRGFKTFLGDTSNVCKPRFQFNKNPLLLTPSFSNGRTFGLRRTTRKGLQLCRLFSESDRPMSREGKEDGPGFSCSVAQLCSNHRGFP